MKKLLMTWLAVLALQFGSAGFSGASAETIELHVLSAQPPVMLSVGMMSDYMLTEINERLKAQGSDYQVEWRESYAGTVAGNTEILSAIQNRVGDMGQVGTLFEGARLPLAQMTFNVPFTGARLPLVLDVMGQLHMDIPALDQQLAKYNLHLLSLMGTDSYVLATKFPVQSVTDLDGRKLGLPGSAANWVKGTGAVPVSSQISEYYNSLKTGVYDGVIVFASALGGFKLYEVAPYITRIGMGAMQSSAVLINKDVWDGLPEDVRAVMTAVGDDYSERLAIASVEQADQALAKAAENGATVTDLSAEERKRWADSMPNIAREWAAPLDQRGLPATELVTRYLSALEERGADIARKWDAQQRTGVGEVAMDRLFGRLTGAMNSIGTLWIFLLMVLINADVIGRNGFNRPIQGVNEIVSMSIVGVVFLQLAHTLRSGRFLRSEFLLDFLEGHNPHLLQILETAYNLLGATVMMLIVYFAIPHLIEAWEIGLYVGTYGQFTFPLWPVRLIVVLGLFVTAIQFLILAARAAFASRGARATGAHDE